MSRAWRKPWICFLEPHKLGTVELSQNPRTWEEQGGLAQGHPSEIERYTGACLEDRQSQQEPRISKLHMSRFNVQLNIQSVTVITAAAGLLSIYDLPGAC